MTKHNSDRSSGKRSRLLLDSAANIFSSRLPEGRSLRLEAMPCGVFFYHWLLHFNSSNNLICKQLWILCVCLLQCKAITTQSVCQRKSKCTPKIQPMQLTGGWPWAVNLNPSGLFTAKRKTRSSQILAEHGQVSLTGQIGDSPLISLFPIRSFIPCLWNVDCTNATCPPVPHVTKMH